MLSPHFYHYKGMFNYSNLIQDRQNKLAVLYIVLEIFLASYFVEIIYKLLMLLVYKHLFH